MEIIRIANASVPTTGGTLNTGNTIANSTAKNNFADSWTLPVNADGTWATGRLFRVEAYGYLSSKSASPGTLQLALNLGSTTLCASTAITLPTSLSNVGWRLNAYALICATGTSGKIASQGFWIIDNAAAAITSAMVNTGTGTSGQITANTQSGQVLQLSAQFSLNDVANTITATQILITEAA